MTTTYSTRFRFNKPDFRTSPWSSEINENTERFDEILYNVLQANSITTYTNNTEIEAGMVVYDTVLASLWLCSVSHTTELVGSFADERALLPTYWASITLGLTVRGQWAIDTYYAVNDLVYDATEGLTGYCSVAHTSAHIGSMRDEIADWNIIFDSDNGGTVTATATAYDDTSAPYVAANVQVALDEANTMLVDNATDNTTNAAALATLNTTVAGHTTTLGGLGTASTHAHGDYATAAQGTLATNALPKSGGTMTGAIDANGYNLKASTVTVTTNMACYGHGGNTGTGAIFYNLANTAYVYFNGTSFTLSHLVYSGISGRLWGTTDFASLPVTSARWVAGAVINSATDSNPYIVTSFAGSVSFFNTKYLQVGIGGVWYTVTW